MKTFYKTSLLLLAAVLFAPAALRAQDEEHNRDEGFAPDGLEINKTVTELGANKYQIDLEAFVTGKTQTTTTEKAVPCDIMLILDVSTSMAASQGAQYLLSNHQQLTTGDNISILHTSTSGTNNYNSTSNGKLRYQIQIGGTGTMYNMIYYSGNWYYGTGTSRTQSWKVYTSKSKNDIIYTDVKIDLLQKAVNDFIAEVKNNAAKDEVDHRIGVATFCGSLKQYCDITSVNNNFTVHTGTNTKQQSMTAFVNDLHNNMAGSTNHHLGFEQAVKLYNKVYGFQEGADLTTSLKSKAAEGRSQVVILFTDGDPNSNQKAVVTNTIESSYVFKKNNVNVYSVGIFTDVNIGGISSPNMKLSQFLDYVSSDYPNATTYGSYGQHIEKQDGKCTYYFKAEGAELSSIFTTIAKQESSGASAITLTATTTTVLDVVSTDFRIPDDVTKDKIELYVAYPTAVSEGANGKPIYTFGDLEDARKKTSKGDLFDIQVSVDREKKEVKVTNFDFSKNFVSEIIEDGVPTGKFTGCKLVIRFNIEIEPNSLGGADVVTNVITSGIWVDEKQIAGFNVPHVKLPNIVVVKKGLHPGESAIFTVTREACYKMNVVVEPMTPVKLVVTCPEEGGDAVSVLKIQVPGRYRVTEDTWSWAYDLSTAYFVNNDDKEPAYTDEEWRATGYYVKKEGELDDVKNFWAMKPTTIGSVAAPDKHYVECNVNDFTETSDPSLPYKGTLFIFENLERDNMPAHAEDMENNKFEAKKSK